MCDPHNHSIPNSWNFQLERLFFSFGSSFNGPSIYLFNLRSISFQLLNIFHLCALEIVCEFHTVKPNSIAFNLMQFIYNLLSFSFERRSINVFITKNFVVLLPFQFCHTLFWKFGLFSLDKHIIDSTVYMHTHWCIF